MRRRPNRKPVWAASVTIAALWITACAGSDGRSADESASPEFSDQDFEREVAGLAEGMAGAVVYVWSPHMPLSVDGYSEIDQAARGMGLAFIPVLFPGSDRDFAMREAQRVGIPDSALREMTAAALLGQDALVHAPTVVVYDVAGRAAKLPGYRNAEGYRAFLEGFISDTSGESAD